MAIKEVTKKKRTLVTATNRKTGQTTTTNKKLSSSSANEFHGNGVTATPKNAARSLTKALNSGGKKLPATASYTKTAKNPVSKDKKLYLK